MIPLFETLILVTIGFFLLGFYLYNRWKKGITGVIESQAYIISCLFGFIIGSAALLAILLLSINPEPPCEWLLSSTNQTTNALNNTIIAYDYNNSCASNNFGIAETLYSILIAVGGLLLIILTIVFAFEFIKIVKKVFRRW